MATPAHCWHNGYNKEKGEKKAMMQDLPPMGNLQLENKTVLLRVDFDVPMEGTSQVKDDLRLRTHLPTIRHLLAQKARVVLLAHRGQPQGRTVPDLSLRPLAPRLSQLLGRNVAFVPDCVGRMAEQAVQNSPPASILLMENVRFHREEMENNPAFSRSLARLGEAFINDALACAPYNHASITGLANQLPSAAGLRLTEEVNRLHTLLESPKRPFVMILGGTKLARKVDMIKNIIFHADQILVGGTIAHTLLAAKDMEVGRSQLEPDYLETMRNILVEAGIVGCRILLPQDVVVSHSLGPDTPTTAKMVDKLTMNDTALDIGPQTIRVWSRVIQNAGTIVWNGPVGTYEVTPFDEGTNNLANAVIHSDAATLAAGGNTLDALHRCELRDRFDALCTGSRAFMDLLAGHDLPGLQALREAASARRSLRAAS
jgi:3-phosphoglycerate kinase